MNLDPYPLTKWAWLYASRRCTDVQPRQWDALFSASCRFNDDNGLTGILLYTDDRFVQYLEGNRDAVEVLSERIIRDPRHFDVVTLFKMTRTPLSAGRRFVVEGNRSSYVAAIIRKATDDAMPGGEPLARMLRLLQEFMNTSA